MDINVNFNVKLECVDDILAILRQTLTLVKQMSAELDTVVQKVIDLETVEESAVTLLTELKTKLDEAISTGDQAALQALSDRLGADTQKLADAVTANTPVEPSPTPVPDPTPVTPAV